MLLLLLLQAAASAYDPAVYIAEKAATTPPAVRQGDVVIGGRPFLKLQSDSGAIYLPKLTHLTKDELDSALCVSRTEKPRCDLSKTSSWVVDDQGRHLAPQCADDATGGVTAMRAEAPLSGDYVAYTDLILLTIQAKCGGGAATPNFSLTGGPGGEAGIEKRHSGRAPGSSKVFLRTKDVRNPENASPQSLRPQAGFGVGF